MLSLKENIAKVIPVNLFFLDLVENKAQSRIKILEKMKPIIIEENQKVPTFNFEKNTKFPSGNILQHVFTNIFMKKIRT